MIKKLFLFLTILLSIMFLYISNVKITNCSISKDGKNFKKIVLPFSKNSLKARYFYNCEIYSKIPQKVKLNFIVDDEILSMKLNNKSINLSPIKKRYKVDKLNDYRRGYDFELYLSKGENGIVLETLNYGGQYSLKIYQKFYWWQALLFIVALVSFFILIFPFLDQLLIKLLRIQWKRVFFYMPWFIIIIGIVLRIIYILKTNQYSFTHDVPGHKELIKYYAEHFFSLPLPHKGLEYPQQPLYYWINAIFYKILSLWHFSSNKIFEYLRWVSFIFSIFWLITGYFTAKIIFKKNLFATIIFLLFLSLTPYFIFLSGQINNDTLNALLGMMSFYFITRYFFYHTKRDFLFATIFISLGILTKVSSLLYAVYFILLLLYRYIFQKEQEKNYILLFTSIIIAIFLWTLWRVYLPAEGFHFVNSSLYKNQTIPALDFSYFFSFHPFTLIKEAQSYVFGANSIRFSFPTYQYGTMIFGEYRLEDYFKPPFGFKLLSQLVLLLNFIYVVGFIGYLIFFRKLSMYFKTLIIPVLINLLLIIKFLFSYWSVCNSDFRYFSPTYGIIAAIFTIGLMQLIYHYPFLKKIFINIFILLFMVESAWFIRFLTIL